jgi:hypothetical protein
MAKAEAWVPVSSAIDLLAEAWGREEAISELFHALEDGAVKVHAASWVIIFDFVGRSISNDEKDQIQDGAKTEFWRFIRDQMLGGSSDGVIRRQSLSRGNFDVSVDYGNAAHAHHNISGLLLSRGDVEGFLTSTSQPALRPTSNASERGVVRRMVSGSKLREFISRLKIDTEINRSDVLEIAKKEFPENHVPREMVRAAVNAEFGRGTPGPKKRPN